MQIPDIKITGITFAQEQKGYSKTHTNIVCSIHYEMSVHDTPYTELRVTGEAKNYPDALRDATCNLDWDVYLDASFTQDEISILKIAQQIFKDDQQGSWQRETILAQRASVQMIPGLETNLVRDLARQRLLECHHGDDASQFRISQLGLFIIESHAQFQAEGDD
jgi:hypothetical protein